MLKKHILALAVAVAFTTATPAFAQDVPAEGADAAGFYGGISLRTAGREGDGVTFGHLTSVWSRFTLPVADDAGARTLAYGGYRWANDLALEAALGTTDRYSLQPLAPGGRRGVGLALASDGDVVGKAWNVDVYGTWEFRKSLSLYGRLGYAQSDAQASYAPGFVGDARRSRDGVNYGLGLRYDMSQALGLRLEYARFGRVPGEVVNGVMPENDQLQFGVQFRF
jgi:opacity protein-like surface antigen